MRYDWPHWARDKQTPPPGDWRVWLLLAGRGFGKSRTGAEWVRAQVESGACSRIALVAPTAHDARAVMIEGESGLLRICPAWNAPKYNPSLRRLTWPNGATAEVYTADEPDRLRGPQHDGAWCDEIASWRYAQDAWDMLMFGLRLGSNPQAVVTTTPRPIAILKRIMADPAVITTRGSTFENRANLAEGFFADIVTRYEGTRLGAQELYAELLTEAEGALWKRNTLEAYRVNHAPALRRIVVAIDPAITATDESNETGMIVCGLGEDGHGYVLQDMTLRASPEQWARRAVNAYHDLRADRIIAESNQGGDMVAHTIRTVDPAVPVKLVHARRGKYTRAEPIAALYEQGRIHHVGMFALLEDQLCEWLPGDASPDRLDALVWGMTELMISPGVYRAAAI